ncbi:hypothetical protein fHeYen902_249 [Yersinia phage fHe-Yen9-02]|nr:hypothetical protein fHeYen902_249 [Yersinia phage fHe-Yen9-02]
MEFPASIQIKEHKVLLVHKGNLINDFMRGKFSVVGIECNSRGAYGSPLQKHIAAIFPQMLTQLAELTYDRKLLGTANIFRVPSRGNARQYVANMFLASGYGLGRDSKNRGTKPVNRFSERFLRNAMEQVLESCDKYKLPVDRQIAIQRVYGGLGGVSWAEVQTVLDDICDKHKFSLYAYLPTTYDTQFVRGTTR